MREDTKLYLQRAGDIIESMREYWPLTLRQVYYQLVAVGAIENNQNQYKKLSRVLTRARLDGAVPWEAIEDRSRSILYSGGYTDADGFKSQELDGFLTGYRRDLLQSQGTRPEIWVEKDALSHLVHGVAKDYCIHVVAAKGFSSMTFKNECRNRIVRNAEQGQLTQILYFGDLDPSGWEMLPAMMRTFTDNMDLSELVRSQRIALNPDQVREYDLPIQFEALKKSDSRAKKYIQRFGDLAVELDALKPAVLMKLVREAIEGSLDMSLFQAELTQQQTDRTHLTQLRTQIMGYIQ